MLKKLSLILLSSALAGVSVAHEDLSAHESHTQAIEDLAKHEHEHEHATHQESKKTQVKQVKKLKKAKKSKKK